MPADPAGVSQVIVVGTDGRIVWHDELGGSLNAAIEQALSGPAS